MSGNALEPIVAEAIQAARIRGEKITPHSLRHSMAIRYLQHGSGNVVALSKILGASAITVTQMYLDRLELDELSQTMPRLPLNGDHAG